MKKKKIGLIIITVFIAVFVVTCTIYAYKSAVTAISDECAANFNSTARLLAKRAEDNSDLGELDIYYGNAQVFIIDKTTYDVLYNSANVKIDYEIQKAFEGKGTIANYQIARADVDDSRELVIFALERVVNSTVYTVKQSFLMLATFEGFAFIAYVYLVFSSSRRGVEKTLLEERLKKAEEADKAKAIFISNMSHDIRNSMNTVMGFTDLAYENASDVNKVRSYLRKTQSSNDHLLTLVNDIVDVNRIENGTISIKEEPQNIYAMASKIDDMVRASVEARGIKFATDFSGIVDEKVYCDRIHLNQIFLNLFSNAIKYTYPGGTISFTINQKNNAPEGFAAYEFRVKDTGIGIGSDFLKHIYDPFARENIDQVNKASGAGLGLTITKHIVDLMNGTIAVKSDPGVGTEFILVFKFRLASTASIESIKDENNVVHMNQLAGKKILLVEDNDLNREMAKELLTDNGFVVIDVDDGTEAVATMEKAAVGDFDAILMDIQMPKMDGYEATKKIRGLQKPQVASTPIIAMTANAFDEDRQKAESVGMNGFVTKPIDLGKLLVTLSKYI